MRLLGPGTLCLWLTAVVAIAQNPPAPTVACCYRPRARKTSDWDALAQALDASIGRLLPCDPKGPAAIEKVSRASDARLAALADHLQVASQQASQDTVAAKRALASSGTLAAGLDAEKNDVAQEQAGADSEFANLVESAKNRAAPPAQRRIQEIRSGLQQRADLYRVGSEAGNRWRRRSAIW